jgi:surfeit locus 1 family protein
MTPDYSFSRQPRWIIGHLIVVLSIGLFISLGFWQLRRNDERSALDAQLAERIAAEPIDAAAAVLLASGDVDLRRVTATGVFDTTEELILQARSFNGRSGHNVLTPLVLDTDEAIIVNRGWVPIDVVGPPVVEASPAAGPVTIVGVARPTEVRRGLGPADPATGVLERVSRVDLERIGRQSSYPLAGFYLQQLDPPNPSGFPLLLDAPEPGGGPPHLAYAVQWFLFSLVVAVGYPLLLRSTARKAVQVQVPLEPESGRASVTS